MKNSFGKVVFQIFAKIERREMKIGYLAAILNLYKYLFYLFIYFFFFFLFFFFCQNMVVISI